MILRLLVMAVALAAVILVFRKDRAGWALLFGVGLCAVLADDAGWLGPTVRVVAAATEQVSPQQGPVAPDAGQPPSTSPATSERNQLRVYSAVQPTPAKGTPPDDQFAAWFTTHDPAAFVGTWHYRICYTPSDDLDVEEVWLAGDLTLNADSTAVEKLDVQVRYHDPNVDLTAIRFDVAGGWAWRRDKSYINYRVRETSVAAAIGITPQRAEALSREFVKRDPLDILTFDGDSLRVLWRGKTVVLQRVKP
jgi:hypothetical protein